METQPLDEIRAKLIGDSKSVLIAALRDVNFSQINNALKVIDQVLATLQPDEKDVSTYRFPENAKLEIDELSYSDACILSVSLRQLLSENGH